MGAALVLDNSALRGLSRPRTSEPSELQRLAQLAGHIATVVESRWAELPAEQRDRIKSLVHAIIEPPRGVRRFISTITGRLFLVIVVLRGDLETLHEYLDAVRRMVNAVLTAVEREHADYNPALSSAIADAANEAGHDRVLAPEDFSGWFADISSQAHREV